MFKKIVDKTKKSASRTTRRNKLVIGICLGLVAVGMWYGTQPKIEPTYSTVDRKEVVLTLSEKSTLESRTAITQTSLQSGQVVDVLVNAGELVKKGQTIAIISDEMMIDDRAALEAQLRSLEAKYAEVVRKPDSELVGNAEGAVAIAERSFDDAERKRMQNEALLESGAISQEEYDVSLTAQKAAEQALIAAKNNLSLLLRGASTPQKNAYKAEIDVLKANLAKMDKQLSNHRINAIHDGLVTSVMVTEGDFISLGAPVLEIVDSNDLFLKSDIMDSDIHRVSEGLKVEVTVDDKKIAAHVDKVHPMVFEKTSELGLLQKRVRVDIKIDGSLKELGITKPVIGQEVDVDFILDSRQGVLAIKKEDVFEKDGKRFVLVKKNGRLAEQNVDIGLEGDDYIEIISGIGEGDPYIDDVDSKIKIGTKLK